VEVAISYARLIDECKLTQEKLSNRLGKSRSSITNFLRLLKLPPELQIALRDDVISMGHARALITVKDEEAQIKILKKVITQGLNVRQVEEIVREMNSGDGNMTKPLSKASLPDKYKQTPAELSLKFSSKVTLKRNSKGKGSLVISFNNDKDLDYILKLMK
jgi:ParB family chromosome partitioning protein